MQDLENTGYCVIDKALETEVRELALTRPINQAAAERDAAGKCRSPAYRDNGG